ncbi:MAG: hypothetical protein DWH99_18490 [Planctomycetota bacterium]|nr:MAG: hypothetical protein DWH99_18490 [Planctomycetota bacterium]
MLVLVRMLLLQRRCKLPCVRANESTILLAWVLVHRQELNRKPVLVLVHSKQPKHRCNPSCGRKYQPKHSTRSRSHIQQSPKQ